MSKLDYQNDSLKLGASRLKLLGKYNELLMQAYAGAAIDELAIGQSALQTLQNADILWRPDPQSGLKLSDPVYSLIAHLLKDERRRKANTDVGDFHENIRHLVGQINQAQKHNQFNQCQYLQNELKQEVEGLNSRIAIGIKSLWQRLNTGFAFVDNLTDKIHENEKASKEVSRWLTGLEHIDFDELILLSGSYAPLRNILVRQLQSQVSEHLSSLREVQKRLGELLVSFRQQHERNLLIRGVVRHFEQQVNFKPSDYAQRSQVPNIINCAKALSIKTAFSLDNHLDQDFIRQLMQTMPARKVESVHLSAAQSLPIETPEAIIQKQRQLQTDVENFFIDTLESKNPQSALHYLHKLQLTWDAEIWLHQVIAMYQGLSIQQKQRFKLSYDEHAASQYNQLLLVRDITLLISNE